MPVIKNIWEFIKSVVIYNYYKNKYRNTDYFQYNKLANPNFIPPKFFNGVFFYGNHKAVAKLKGSALNFITEYLEHGVSFYTFLESPRTIGYVDRKFIKRVYTCSESRCQVIAKYLDSKNLKKDIIALGPYIKGAEYFKSQQELDDIKKKYGKILLVFPMHSIEGATAQYNQDRFLDEIEKVKCHFDSVFVCTYWKDIIETPQHIDIYKQRGYIVVSNGHRSDPKFLSRHKDLIELSTMMITNGYGTHIGYSICMNKPVYYYQQKISYKLSNNPFEGFMSEAEQEIEKLKNNLHNLFGTFSFEITQQQISFIEHFWGKWDKN